MAPEISNLTERFTTIPSPGAKPALRFDAGTAQRVHRSYDTEARVSRIITPLSGRLVAIAPQVARSWVEAVSVYVPPEPTRHRDIGSAVAAVIAEVSSRLNQLEYIHQVGTVGDGAAIMLHTDIDETTLKSQRIFMIDTSFGLHDFWYWDR